MGGSHFQLSPTFPAEFLWQAKTTRAPSFSFRIYFNPGIYSLHFFVLLAVFPVLKRVAAVTQLGVVCLAALEDGDSCV